MDRQTRLLSGLTKSSKLIEIGPSYNPLAPKSDGWNAFTIDHEDRKGLVKKYTPDPSVNVAQIEEVDFVWSGGALADAVPVEQHGTFDAFLASHVIEHTTDVVSFLRSAEDLVGACGRVILAVPDKRKCFDLFRPLSTTGEAIVAHREGRARHTAKIHFDNGAYLVKKHGNPGWLIDDLSDPEFVVPFLDTLAFIDRADAPHYVDAHQWIFTPASFELMILELSALGLVDLHVEDREEGLGTEFFAWLRKGAERLTPQELQARRLHLMNRTVVELAEQSRQIAGSPLLVAEENQRSSALSEERESASLRSAEARAKSAEIRAAAAEARIPDLEKKLRQRGLRAVVKERLRQAFRI